MGISYFVLQIACLSLWVAAEVSSSGVTIGHNLYAHPVSSQYHSQDSYGQYVYGYVTPTSAKSETKSINGVTQGGYSYIDSNGILQSVHYTADPINGFRVAATNLPEDVPAVAYAKAQHLAQYEATKAEHSLAAYNANLGVVSAPIAVQGLPQDLPEVAIARAQHLAQYEATKHGLIAQNNVVLQQNPVQDLPEVVRARAEHLATFEATQARDLNAAYQAVVSPIPAQIVNNVIPIKTSVVNYGVNYAPSASYAYVPATSSQYQTQDSLGQYSYGYVEPLSAKSEIKTADGVTRGGYSYIDANGIIQTVNYVSDPINGFRVAGTNLPQEPLKVAPAVAPAVASAVVPAVVPAHVPVAQYAVPSQSGWYKSEIIY